MKRVCPKCKALSGSRDEFCTACGYQLVLVLSAETQAARRKKPKPRSGAVRRRAAPTRKERPPVDPREFGYKHCGFCGVATCDGEACSVHADLIESGLL